MKLTHPESKQTLDVAPEQVPMYESQGWHQATPPAVTPAKPEK